jgi:hypothetical protein
MYIPEELITPLNTTPKVRKPCFSDLEKHDIGSITNTLSFFVVARALNLVVALNLKTIKVVYKKRRTLLLKCLCQLWTLLQR